MPKLNVNLIGLSHFGKLTGGYFITTVINQAIPFLVLPILTRFLAPEAYANIALFNFYFALSNAVCGISAANVVSKHFFNNEKSYVAKIIGNSIYSVGLFSVGTIILILILYPFFGHYIDLPLYMLIITPVVSFSYIVFSLGLNVMRNSQKVFTFSKHQIFNTLVNISLSLIFIIVISVGWQGRVWGVMIAAFVSALISLYYLTQKGFLVFKFEKPVFKEVLNVITPLIPNSFQAVLIAQSGIFFIQLYFSKSLLGVYSVGYQLSYAIYFLGATLTMSWSPFFYEHLSKSNISKLYITRMLYLISGVLVAGLVFLIVFKNFIVSLMTTAEYSGAANFIPYFALGYFFLMFSNFFQPVLIKYGKQRFISLVSLTSMIVVITLNIVLPKYYGPLSIAFAFCIGYFIRLVAVFIMAHKILSLPWLKALKIWK